MAPPVFIRSINDPMTLKAAHNWKLLQDVFEKVHLYNTFAFSPELHQEFEEFCNLMPTVCSQLADIHFLLPSVDNMQRADVMFSSFPSGAGYRSTVYYGQCVANGGNFRKFDYGKDANMAIYGQETPPDFPIEDIDMPIAIFNGSLDDVVLEADVDYLIERLGDNVVYHKVIEADHWTFSMA